MAGRTGIQNRQLLLVAWQIQHFGDQHTRANRNGFTGFQVDPDLITLTERSNTFDRCLDIRTWRGNVMAATKFTCTSFNRWPNLLSKAVSVRSSGSNPCSHRVWKCRPLMPCKSCPVSSLAGIPKREQGAQGSYWNATSPSDARIHFRVQREFLGRSGCHENAASERPS